MSCSPRQLSKPFPFLPLASAAVALASLFLGAAAPAASAPRVLFLSKSSGFEHSVIQERDGGPGVVQKVLTQLGPRHGFEITTTKDASLIESAQLENYDVVIFYTTGDLTQAGSGSGLFGGDGQTPMGESGVEDLLGWIERGGGFLGFHCATDTFKSTDLGLAEEATTPYIEMIGAQFRGHGPQFEGTLRLVDAEHPVAAHLQDGAVFQDEWYTFSHLDRENLHAIALLDAGPQKEKLPKLYEGANYPVIWTKAYGAGRIYYNAMGHREDVWANPTFQLMVVDAITWASGSGGVASAPNLLPGE
jgi:type 1 glutamine amidotransferase